MLELQSVCEAIAFRRIIPNPYKEEEEEEETGESAVNV